MILAAGSIFHFTFTAAWIFVPLIEAEFTTELVTNLFLISWVYSAPLLAFVIFIFLGGMITDKIGYRNATIISGIFITIFGILRGLSSNYLFFIITSFLFGIGGGLLFPNLAKIVADWFEDEKKGTASGIYLMAGGLGQVFSLSITIAVLLPLFHSNWRLCFVFYGIFSLIISILWVFVVKEKETTQKTAASSLSRAALKQILTNKYVLGLCVIIFFAFSVLLGYTNYIEDFITEKGLSYLIYGYLASILSLGTTTGNITIPILSDKAGRRKIFLICCSIIAISLIGALQVTNIGLLLWFIMFFVGLMVGTLIPMCLAMCIEIKSLPEDLAGTVSGTVLSLGFFGGFMVSLIFGTLLVYGTFLFCTLYLLGLGVAALILSFMQQK